MRLAHVLRLPAPACCSVPGAAAFGDEPTPAAVATADFTVDG